jgi:hypothetical protein
MQKVFKNNVLFLGVGGVLPYLIALIVQNIDLALNVQRNYTYTLLSIMLVFSVVGTIRNLFLYFNIGNFKYKGVVITVFVLLGVFLSIFSFFTLGILYSTRNGIGF